MKARIKYTESSKAVTTEVLLEKDIDDVTESGHLIEEAQRMFDKAQKYAITKTMQKMR